MATMTSRADPKADSAAGRVLAKKFAVSEDDVSAIVGARHHNPFAVLGPH